jgi:PAS domain S-box-containing protein
VDGIISDISQRKHNEMRIEALLAEQSAILDNVMFGVMFVRHRTIVSVNRRCEELFGYEPGAMTGSSTAMLFLDAFDYESSGARQYPSLSQGDYQRRAPVPPQGRQRVLVLVSGYALDHNRANEGSIWVFADITAQGSGKNCACPPP